MSVAKRPWTTNDGETHTAWVVRYYDADGFYRTKTCPTQREAKAWEAQTKVDLGKGTHRPDSTSATIAAVAKLWLARKRAERHEDETIEVYERHVRLHILPATILNPEEIPNGWVGKLGDLKLSRLTPAMCDAFALLLCETHTKKKGQKDGGHLFSRRMIRHVFASFKSILKEGVRRTIIAFSPAQEITIDIKGRHKRRIRIGDQIPDRPDVRAILAACDSLFWRTLYMTTAFAGLRSSEIRGLAWKFVDLDKQVIQVEQRADDDGDLGPCKSPAGFREIQIGDQLAKQLRLWKKVCPSSDLDLVFCDPSGNVITRRRVLYNLYRVQRQIGMKRLGGEGKYNMHSLRHFYASIMIDEGTAPKRLQELLGHTTLEMTMDTYGHLFPASTNEIARINRAMATVLADE